MITTIEYTKHNNVYHVTLENVRWTDNEQAYNFDVTEVEGADDNGDAVFFDPTSILDLDDYIEISDILKEQA